MRSRGPALMQTTSFVRKLEMHFRNHKVLCATYRFNSCGVLQAPIIDFQPSYFNVFTHYLRKST